MFGWLWGKKETSDNVDSISQSKVEKTTCEELVEIESFLEEKFLKVIVENSHLFIITSEDDRITFKYLKPGDSVIISYVRQDADWVVIYKLGQKTYSFISYEQHSHLLDEVSKILETTEKYENLEFLKELKRVSLSIK